MKTWWITISIVHKTRYNDIIFRTFSHGIQITSSAHNNKISTTSSKVSLSKSAAENECQIGMRFANGFKI